MAAAGNADPALIRPLLSSQLWMLEAAGVDTSGPAGALRVTGLAAIYASVFRTWLEDDDPGQARTMAALDRRLRRGERTLRTVAGVASGLERFASAVPAMLRSVLARTGKTDAPKAPTPDAPGP
jgi:hypothetical protein